MKIITALQLGLAMAALPALAGPPTAGPPTPAATVEFVANQRQWEKPVLFAADVPAGRLYLEQGRLVQALYDGKQVAALHHHSAAVADKQRIRAHAYSTTFVGANAQAVVRGEQQLPGYSNYFLGNDQSRWASKVPGFGEVRYEELYPGTDLHFYSKGGALEYDFELAAGADASRIVLRYNGQDKLSVADGALHIGTTVGTVVEQRPYAYQLVGGQRQRVACEYALAAGGTVRFALPNGYNHALPLVIDPVLVYSSYTGSPAENWGYTATYDSLGNMYSAGIVFSIGFPTTVGAYNLNFAGVQDMGIIKYNTRAANGPSSRLYATYIGGSQDDHPQSMVVDPAGNLVIMGSSSSNNFPTTTTAYDRTANGNADIVVCKLNFTGTALLASTYLGGSNSDGQVIGTLSHNYGDTYRGDVTTDKRGNIYLASVTQSTNFPALNGFQVASGGGASDAVVMKLNSGLTAITWSDYLGGSGDDAGYSIALDSVNNIFVSGGTSSSNFPGRQQGFHPTYQGGTDGFVARISSNGDDLVQSTYIGTSSYDQAYFVQLNKRGEVYTYGQTDGVYAVSAGVYSNPGSRQFIQKLNARLNTSLLSTVIGNGAAGQISPTAFLVDNCGQIVISGWGGNNVGFPVTPNALRATGGSGSFGYFYIAQLSGDGRNLVYATFFGSGSSHVDGGTSRFDKKGIIYQAMCTGSGILPTTPNAWSATTSGSSWNNAAFKIDVLQLDATFTPSIVNLGPAIFTYCAPARVLFYRPAVAGTGTRWDFGNGQTSTTPNLVSALYQNPGIYAVRLTVYDSASCVQSVTKVDTIKVYGLPRAAAGPDKNICAGASTTLSVADAGPGVTYSWFPPTGLSTTTGRTVQATPAVNTIYIVRAVTPMGCQGADTIQVLVAPAPRLTVAASTATAFTNEVVTFTSTVQAPVTSYRWDFGDGQTGIGAAPAHTYTQAGDFLVRVTAIYGVGCQEQAVVPVRIRKFELPNVITPNNDGKNDSFQPFVSFTPVDAKIFNRWGRLVYERTNYVKEWGDENTANGIYYYHLTGANGVSWKGWIEVIH